MPERQQTIIELAASVPEAQIFGGNAVVNSVVHDSRDVRPGALFVAVVGEKFDGHRFVGGAVVSGAAAVVVQSDRAGEFADLAIPRIVVPSTRAALAPLACRFYGDPTLLLYLAGVTGTNGKTTTVRMIDAIARAAGDRTGVVGTLGATIDGHDLPGERTTPEASDLQRMFADMCDAGVASAAIEVASHAIAMGRIEGCLFDVGVFTNVTQDHLDFHGTMEAYRDTKLRLFTEYADAARAGGKTFSAVINNDDESGRYFADSISKECRVLRYGERDSQLPGPDISYDPAEAVKRIDTVEFIALVRDSEYARLVNGPRQPFVNGGLVNIPVKLPFGGEFNIYNALAAVGYGVACGLSPEVIAAGLAACPPVPGRFQPVRAGQDFAVLVDYAHTPDGLDNVLRSARRLTGGRLIVVFGCGGDRDRTKRPKMGGIAGDLADLAFVTSDNPRTESPDAIIDEIMTGMDGVRAVVFRQPDRRAAISEAIRFARSGDTVVIAGKGHETYQIIGDTPLPFDDARVAAEEIRNAA